jgi:NADH-quinone oxidoreductase subunit M
MLELHFPWLELAILAPLVGAALVGRLSNPEDARKRALYVTGLTLFLTVGAWEDFSTLHTYEAHDYGSLLPDAIGDAIVVDELSAPLLPLAALLFFLTTLATLRTKVRRFPFVWNLVSLSMILAMLCCREPWGIIALLAAQVIPPTIELRARGRSARVFLLHMIPGISLFVAGWMLIEADGATPKQSNLGIGMLMVAVLIRSGVAPFHCWVTDLFENATLGTALLFMTPMAGAYAAVRLVLPIAPDWALRTITLISLATAVYAAGMTLVQREARRFFVYLFLSHSSLVLIGLEVATPIGLTGGLCVWLSVGISLAGLGITLRALEARTGRLSLAVYHGLYEHMPSLAVFFLITGLASIGFPGTVGFIGMELLIEGAVEVYPAVAVMIVLAAALNGIAVMHAYFRLFTGTHHTASISLTARWPEKAAILVLTALIFGGGLAPQPGVRSRYHAAAAIMARRNGEPQRPTLSQRGKHVELDAQPPELKPMILALREYNPKKLLIDPEESLSYVNLSDSEVDNAAVQFHRGQAQLVYLNLSNTSITDDGLASLSDLTNLIWLSLHDTLVGDEGMQYLRRLKALKNINLANTNLTDLALQRLKHLEHLQALSISDTGISDEGIEIITDQEVDAAMPFAGRHDARAR